MNDQCHTQRHVFTIYPSCVNLFVFLQQRQEKWKQLEPRPPPNAFLFYECISYIVEQTWDSLPTMDELTAKFDIYVDRIYFRHVCWDMKCFPDAMLNHMHRSCNTIMNPENDGISEDKWELVCPPERVQTVHDNLMDKVIMQRPMPGIHVARCPLRDIAPIIKHSRERFLGVGSVQKVIFIYPSTTKGKCAYEDLFDMKNVPDVPNDGTILQLSSIQHYAAVYRLLIPMKKVMPQKMAVWDIASGMHVLEHECSKWRKTKARLTPSHPTTRVWLFFDLHDNERLCAWNMMRTNLLKVEGIQWIFYVAPVCTV